VAFFTGLPGRIASAASGMWNAVYNQAVGIYNGVVGLWNGLMNWFAGLPARIAWIAGSMWSGVTNAFRAAINSLIDIWNRLHFTIGGWHIGPVGIPTVSVGMPPIPHLAQGGLITASGLAVVHAGERVLPAQARPARGGPVVHIDHAHFAQKMDVDAFMDRVAWAARKTAV